MDRSKALFNFNSASDTVLSTRGRAIVAALTANPNFTNIGAVLTTLTADYKAYADALDIARVGSPAQKAFKNAAKITFLASLQQACDYVNLIASGNRAALLTTAFTLNKEVFEKTVIKNVEDFTVTDSAIGQVKLSMRPDIAARSSFFARSVGTDAKGNIIWQTQPSTLAEYVFEDLPLGEVLSFQAGYVGARNQTVYSPVLTHKVR